MFPIQTVENFLLSLGYNDKPFKKRAIFLAMRKCLNGDTTHMLSPF